MRSKRTRGHTDVSLPLLFVAMACVGASLLGTHVSVSAHNYGFCNTVAGCRPDDMVHSACWNDTGTQTQARGAGRSRYSGCPDRRLSRLLGGADGAEHKQELT